MLTLLITRLSKAYATWPPLAEWGLVALLFAAFLGVTLPIALVFEVATFRVSTEPLMQLALVAVIALFVPSLLEETLYRAILLPQPEEEASLSATLGQAALSIGLFVAGHPFAAWAFRLGPEAEKLFYSPAFLALAAMFGIACSVAYLRTGSIWPGVAMHWLLVVAWVLWFGGFISGARAV